MLYFFIRHGDMAIRSGIICRWFRAGLGYLNSSSVFYYYFIFMNILPPIKEIKGNFFY